MLALLETTRKMPRAYGEDFRFAVLQHYELDPQSISKTARVFGIDRATVASYVNRLHIDPNYFNCGEHQSSPSILEREDIVTACVEDPFRSAREIKQYLG